ncbi:hypothetical protein GDO86_005656 [Hymenochirus boettgeri]|uniref:Neurotensin/neuromedin N n=1 Tax=Hymenochirus boettgeri TaxID=247094 RepID=A0A8T2J7V5_9PIPI|nr:hypothetical protein GDO86_005656 [Hymenochirus boettgeri]
MAATRTQLVCVMLLTFTCSGMCTGSEEERNAVESDVLSNIYSAKVNNARLSYWKMTLLNVCGLINNLNNQAVDAEETGDEEFVLRKQYPTAIDGFNLEAMLTLFQLQNICQSRVLPPREFLQQDYLEPSDSVNSEKEELMKRKTPYIFKRQAHVSKARRPYILKRDSFY